MFYPLNYGAMVGFTGIRTQVSLVKSQLLWPLSDKPEY